MRTVPNLLTLLRILLIPVMMAAFYLGSRTGYLVAAICFMLACATDYLDGLMARLLSQTSKLGQFLDPTADKLLISSTILLLAGFGKISTLSLIPAVIILCREIMVSGLREVLIELDVPMPVTRLAKWKTAFQMLSLTSLMFSQAMPFGPLDLGSFLTIFGEALLWFSAFLTLVTGTLYLKAGLRHF